MPADGAMGRLDDLAECAVGAALPFDKLALFDFDGTLVNYDTVNPFIRYVLRKHPELNVEPDRSLPHKQYRLKLLAGLSRDELFELGRGFYEKEIKPHLIAESVGELIRLRDAGYHVCVCSGSYDPYLRHFCAEYGVDTLICTWVGYEDGVCTGLFGKLDCLGENKLELLREEFGTCDFTGFDSRAFSDAQSDIPLLDTCAQAFVMVPSDRQPAEWIGAKEYPVISYAMKKRTRLWRKLKWLTRRALRID